MRNLRRRSSLCYKRFGLRLLARTATASVLRHAVTIKAKLLRAHGRLSMFHLFSHKYGIAIKFAMKYDPCMSYFPEHFKMSTSIFPSTRQWNHAHFRQASASSIKPAEITSRTSKRFVELILPETVKWAHSIPLELRPSALVTKFPRIANAMANAWRQPKLFNMLVCQLMQGARGARQGFPFDVLQDLAHLREHFECQYRQGCTEIGFPTADSHKNQLN